ncbi:hypothetical protein Bbelb_081530 [Branchiostoma belcheri]|nr:hypothetical protein Bbelb_081530 [Branchiostoma belcheri]
MSDFPQRLHKFTEALKGLVQSYPKVTVWDHRRLWRRNPNYFAPHARSQGGFGRNLEVPSSSGKNPIQNPGYGHAPDGLHLSDLGNLQYYKSVRGAVDRQLKHI